MLLLLQFVAKIWPSGLCNHIVKNSKIASTIIFLDEVFHLATPDALFYFLITAPAVSDPVLADPDTVSPRRL